MKEEKEQERRGSTTLKRVNMNQYGVRKRSEYRRSNQEGEKRWRMERKELRKMKAMKKKER